MAVSIPAAQYATRAAPCGSGSKQQNMTAVVVCTGSALHVANEATHATRALINQSE